MARSDAGSNLLLPVERQQINEAARGEVPFIWFLEPVDDGDREGLKLRDASRRTLRLKLLKGKSLFAVGRNPSNDVVVESDPAVSRLHAQIRNLGGEWVVEDDGLSAHGTFVNGERVGGKRRLSNDDRIGVGNTNLVFIIPERIEADTEGAEVLVTGEPVGATRVEVTRGQRVVLVELCRPRLTQASKVLPSNKQIADKLFVSVNTVKTHLGNLYSAFSLGDEDPASKRALLVERAVQSGVVRDSDCA